MRNRSVARGLVLLSLTGLLAAAATGIAFAASSSGGGAVVLTKGKEGWETNALVSATLRFAPQVIRVASGESVTFVKADRNEEPHTVTISTKKGLPHSFESPCPACNVVSGHLKNPDAENSGIKSYVLDKGKPGFERVGDSLFLAPKGPHARGTVVISAPAGTTLHYLCAIHPWMQGSIKVTQ